VVTIQATDPTATEGGDAGSFTVTRTGPTAAGLQVKYATGGTATNGTDYQSLPGTVTIPAGESSATIAVTPTADQLAEGTETATVILGADLGVYQVGSPDRATVTISDAGLPTVTVEATDATASEPGADTGTFTFTRTGPTTFPLYVGFSITGTASSGYDYQLDSYGTVTILAGETNATVTVTPIDDQPIEPDETVVVTINASPTTYLVGTQRTATVTIVSND